MPAGVVNVGGEWFYEEFSRGSGGGVSSLGMESRTEAVTNTAQPEGPAPEERRRILDLFRN